jgi:hypothetical protein
MNIVQNRYKYYKSDKMNNYHDIHFIINYFDIKFKHYKL